MPVESAPLTKKVYLLAGEASGDLHGANLIHHLKARSKQPLDIYGVGGDRIRESGAKNFYDLAHFHVTGISAAIKKLPEYKRAARKIFSDIEKARPDLVVLIDNPGFNLHMAEKIHALGIPIVYFIAPQVWAWNAKRVFKIKKWVKKVLVVFEFEKDFFERHGVPVSWVGHPLKDMVTAERTPHGRVVALLPGSRKGEINTLFSIFLKSAARIRAEVPDAKFIVVKAPTLPREVYEQRIKKAGVDVRIVDRDGYSAIASSELVIACSGTATLECAILGTPMVIVNRGSLLTYLVARTVIKVPYLGLPNLILGEGKFPELLQNDATPEKIAKESVRLLTDQAAREAMKKDCEEVSRRIGEKGASVRAAEEILALL